MRRRTSCATRMPSVTMLSRTPRRPLLGGTIPAELGPLIARPGWEEAVLDRPKPMLAKVVRLEDEDAGPVVAILSEIRKDAGKEDSKNCSRSSSARTTMRNVGSVMWRGFDGSRAAFAASDWALETLRRDSLLLSGCPDAGGTFGRPVG